jgi:hypothetical protein
MKRLLFSAAAVAAALFFAAPASAAHGPYVVLKDDGTLNGKVTNPSVVLDTVSKAYDKTKAPRPEILSVWTAFDMDQNYVETLFDPAANDVKGIGLEEAYGGADGTFPSDYPPLRAMLLHNNVLKLDTRAQVQSAAPDAFAEYLFLLELTHVWGPALKIAVPEGGAATAADGLIGFPFHWSFWLDAGGSPAGGNRWKDEGGGTFSVAPQSPSDITYSMLDLYIMGLADASEVPPFGLIENAVPPADIKDPFSHGSFNASSFPWFGTAPFKVTSATRRTITIDEIIAKNGARVPARTSSPQSFKLGIALIVAQNATDADIAKAEAAMDKVASRLAPAFARATRGRGTLDLVNQSVADPIPDAGTSEPPPADPPPPDTTQTTSDGGGCTAAASSPDLQGAFALALAAAIAGSRLRRTRSRRS